MSTISYVVTKIPRNPMEFPETRCSLISYRLLFANNPKYCWLIHSGLENEVRTSSYVSESPGTNFVSTRTVSIGDKGALGTPHANSLTSGASWSVEHLAVAYIALLCGELSRVKRGGNWRHGIYYWHPAFKPKRPKVYIFPHTSQFRLNWRIYDCKKRDAQADFPLITRTVRDFSLVQLGEILPFQLKIANVVEIPFIAPLSRCIILEAWLMKLLLRQWWSHIHSHDQAWNVTCHSVSITFWTVCA